MFNCCPTISGERLALSSSPTVSTKNMLFRLNSEIITNKVSSNKLTLYYHSFVFKILDAPKPSSIFHICFQLCIWSRICGDGEREKPTAPQGGKFFFHLLFLRCNFEWRLFCLLYRIVEKIVCEKCTELKITQFLFSIFLENILGNNLSIESKNTVQRNSGTYIWSIIAKKSLLKEWWFNTEELL